MVKQFFVVTGQAVLQLVDAGAAVLERALRSVEVYLSEELKRRRGSSPSA